MRLSRGAAPRLLYTQLLRRPHRSAPLHPPSGNFTANPTNSNLSSHLFSEIGPEHVKGTRAADNQLIIVHHSRLLTVCVRSCASQGFAVQFTTLCLFLKTCCRWSTSSHVLRGWILHDPAIIITLESHSRSVHRNCSICHAFGKST